MTKNKHGQTFRVDGFTCIGCAREFEDRVKSIPGVTDATVHFGSSTLHVEGDVSISSLQKAGAFKSLCISDHLDPLPPKQAFWKRPESIRMFFSIFFIVTGWFFQWQSPEDRYLYIAFYVLAMVIGGYQLFFAGIRSIFDRSWNVKSLMTIAIIGASAIGEWSEGAALVVLFAISETLERSSMNRARQSIRMLMDLSPDEALIRRDGQEMVISVKEIQIGDTLIVKPGQKIAMDGRIIKGISHINQSTVTGESLPVSKSEGDEVYAGTLNEEGLLEVYVTKRVKDTTVAKMVHLVEEAQDKKAPTQSIVDRFAQYYTPLILCIGIAIFVLPPILWGGDWVTWLYRGLSVLVIGCPCALVISTPVSFITAIGNAARNGLLIKGGAHLEEAAKLSVMAFDKTGTLTTGKPEVTQMISFTQQDVEEHLRIAASIEKNIQHPLAVAIVKKCAADTSDIQIEESISIAGKGVKSTIGGTVYFLGNPKWVLEQIEGEIASTDREKILALQEQGKSIVLLGTKNQVLALFAVEDPVRESTKEIISCLKKIGIQKTVMLTGDHVRTAQLIGEQAGVDSVEAELLPEMKLQRIRQLQEDGYTVAMVGDGVNDSPAIATATIGIAMGGAGSDTALETADVVLMADDLNKLPYMMRLSRATSRVIKQNIVLSLGLKIMALLMIIPGWLSLWMAIFADMGATVLVTMNALRLKK